MGLHTAARACAVAIVLACGIAAAPAQAQDVETYVPNALTPAATPTPAPGQPQTRATPMSGYFNCAVPYASVQAAPSGYVIGNCLNGWQLRRTAKSDQYNGTYWDGGFIAGLFNGCGWIQVNWSTMTGAGTTGACAPGSVGYNTNEFASSTNDSTDPNNNCTNNGNGCTDGTPVAVSWPQGCYMYANFRPWLSGQTASNTTYFVPAGTVVRWRYVAKYTGSPDTMVMVRHPGVAAGQGNWGFMGKGCFSSLPYEVPVS